MCSTRQSLSPCRPIPLSKSSLHPQNRNCTMSIVYTRSSRMGHWLERLECSYHLPILHVSDAYQAHINVPPVSVLQRQESESRPLLKVGCLQNHHCQAGGFLADCSSTSCFAESLSPFHAIEKALARCRKVASCWVSRM